MERPVVGARVGLSVGAEVEAKVFVGRRVLVGSASTGCVEVAAGSGLFLGSLRSIPRLHDIARKAMTRTITITGLLNLRVYISTPP
jgi:hypothetical protein